MTGIDGAKTLSLMEAPVEEQLVPPNKLKVRCWKAICSFSWTCGTLKSSNFPPIPLNFPGKYQFL